MPKKLKTHGFGYYFDKNGSVITLMLMNVTTGKPVTFKLNVGEGEDEFNPAHDTPQEIIGSLFAHGHKPLGIGGGELVPVDGEVFKILCAGHSEIPAITNGQRWRLCGMSAAALTAAAGCLYFAEFAAIVASGGLLFLSMCWIARASGIVK